MWRREAALRDGVGTWGVTVDRSRVFQGGIDVSKGVEGVEGVELLRSQGEQHLRRRPSPPCPPPASRVSGPLRWREGDLLGGAIVSTMNGGNIPDMVQEARRVC
jgi:hypothetical protein